ncbi:unnamed protein product [Dibothriocephalus latus]|uniref:Uncharacterized protein n=1 Tax=Dibothriocephalus latus TaxID=60516 RepID=A0A3P6RJ37_DIBLA|nr:unnamed protein product [Dibothriocephalus latus]
MSISADEFPILSSLPASAPASNQHPATELSMPLPPPSAAHGSLLPLVPSSPPTSQQLEMTADSPRFLATIVTKTEDPTPTPTVTESRQDMEPENLFKTTVSCV